MRQSGSALFHLVRGLAIAVILGWATASMAADDLPHDQITLAMCDKSEVIWIVDTANGNKPKEFTIKYYRATQNWQQNHVRTAGSAPGKTARDLAHDHVKTTFTEAEQAGHDLYWDARFYEGTKTTGSGTGTLDSTTCHEYALTTSPMDGVYNFWMVSPMDAVGDDTVSRGVKSTAVQTNDILSYGSTHSSLVTDTRARGEGTEPSQLKWTWMFSRVYTYTTPANDDSAFSTPMCEGAEDPDKAITAQGWTWNPDHVSNPDVRKDP